MEKNEKEQIPQIKSPIYYKIQFIAIVLLTFIIWILLYLISEKMYLRKDFSKSGVSSLSDGTKKLLGKLVDYLDITLALSISKLPEQAESFKRRIIDLVEELKASGGNFVRTQIVDPDDPKYAKEAEPIKKKVDKLTLQRAGVGEFSLTEIYSAIIISYQDKSDIIYIDLQNVDRLEYEIAFRIQKFLRGGKKPKIAFIEGHSERDIYKDYSIIRQTIESSFDITTVNLSEQKKFNLKGYDIVIIMAPIKDFTYKELVAIDQYILNGGNLIIMYDGIDIPPKQFIGVPIKNEKFQEFMESLGVKVNNDFVFDINCESVQFREEVKGVPVLRIVPYGLWIKIDRSFFNPELLFLKDIATIFWPWGSSLEILKDKLSEVKKEVIFTSTEYGVSVQEETNIDPMRFKDYFSTLQKGQDTYKKAYKADKKTLGVYLNGKFKSFFAGKKDLPPDVAKTIENFEGGFKYEGVQNAKVVIFGNSKFLNNQFTNEEMGASPENKIFFYNLVEWLVQAEELLSVRSKGVGTSFIRQDLSYEDKMWFTVIGSLTIPVIFLIIGFTTLLIRKISQKLVYE